MNRTPAPFSTSLSFSNTHTAHLNIENASSTPSFTMLRIGGNAFKFSIYISHDMYNIYIYTLFIDTYVKKKQGPGISKIWTGEIHEFTSGWKVKIPHLLQHQPWHNLDGRNVAHQLRLVVWVVYPIIYKVLYIPGGAGFLPTTVPAFKLIMVVPHTNCGPTG